MAKPTRTRTPKTVAPKGLTYEDLKAELGDKLVIGGGSAWVKARPLDNPLVPFEQLEETEPYDNGKTGLYYVASDGNRIMVRGSQDADQFEWYEVIASRDATNGYGTFKKDDVSVALFAAE